MYERMLELIDIINEADYNYHTLDNPTITDQEYDKYIRELYEIEEEHPEWVRENSPHAGGKIIDAFEKATHKIPMMSLSNVFSESEIITFDEIGLRQKNSEEFLPCGMTTICEFN